MSAPKGDALMGHTDASYGTALGLKLAPALGVEDLPTKFAGDAHDHDPGDVVVGDGQYHLPNRVLIEWQLKFQAGSVQCVSAGSLGSGVAMCQASGDFGARAERGHVAVGGGLSAEDDKLATGHWGTAEDSAITAPCQGQRPSARQTESTNRLSGTGLTR